LAWLTPGPLFVLIIRNSLVYSRKSGIYTAIGIAAGNVVHIAYSVTGLSLVIASSEFAYNILKYLGICYLIYLAVKTIMLNNQSNNHDYKTNQNYYLSPIQSVKIGFLANILSPKAALFFAGIFGSVIGSGSPKWVIFSLWFLMTINSFIMASLLSLLFTQNKIKNIYSKFQTIINKLLGATLLILSLIIILKS
jgi:threonine/homoserine/homoserine lactone efflux protein